MGIDEHRATVFSSRKEVFRDVQGAHVTVIGAFGEQVANPFAVFDILHEIVQDNESGAL